MPREPISKDIMHFEPPYRSPSRPPSPLLLAKILATEKCKHKANQPEKKILKIKII